MLHRRTDGAGELPGRDALPGSERELDADSSGAWECRVKVNVIDPIDRLSRQARGVEVVDVGDPGVEDVERFEHDSGIGRDPVADFAVPQRRAPGRDARVLNERPRAEMTNAQAPEDRPSGLDGHAGRNDAIERARYARSRGVVVREPRAGEGEVSLQGQPRRQACVVRPLDANAPAGAAGFGRAGVAHEEQLRYHSATVD
jgi:hypothetical protein